MAKADVQKGKHGKPRQAIASQGLPCRNRIIRVEPRYDVPYTVRGVRDVINAVYLIVCAVEQVALTAKPIR